jgi:hypothetical protein
MHHNRVSTMLSESGHPDARYVFFSPSSTLPLHDDTKIKHSSTDGLRTAGEKNYHHYSISDSSIGHSQKANSTASNKC